MKPLTHSIHVHETDSLEHDFDFRVGVTFVIDKVRC